MVVTTHIFLFEYMKFGWSKLICTVSVKYASDFNYIVWKIKNVHIFNNFYIHNILKYFRYLKYIVQINFIASFYFNVVTTKFKTRYVSFHYLCVLPGRGTACVKALSPERLGAFEEMEDNTVSGSNVTRQGVYKRPGVD